MRSNWRVLVLAGVALVATACGPREDERFPIEGSLEIVETGELLEISDDSTSLARNYWYAEIGQYVFYLVARERVSIVPEDWGSFEEVHGVPPEMSLAIYFRSGVDLPNDRNRLGLGDLEATDGFIPLVDIADWSHGLAGAAHDPAGCPVSGLSDPDGAEIEIVGAPPEFETITIRVDNTCQRGEFVITR
jgi:hypothetical protein